MTKNSLLGVMCMCVLGCGHAHDQTPSAATPTTANSLDPAPAQPEQTVDRATPKPTAAGSAEPGAMPSDGAEPPPLATDSIESFMLDHFVITTWARDAIVDGDIETVREPLLALAEYRYESVAPGGWMKDIAQLQAAARLTGRAQTLTAAAGGIAAMGRVCGKCHADHGGPDVHYYKPEKSTPRSDSFDSRMFRHAWAVERMWEGLTAPSDNAWAAGAAALAQAPSAAPKTSSALQPGVIQTLTLVRELGMKAANASSAQARELVYGELLATCAECHREGLKIDL